MPARPAMAPLITKVRELIDDPTGANQALTDEQIQDALDRSRKEIRYGELQALETRTAGTIEHRDYIAGNLGSPWEVATLYSSSWAALNPQTVDLIAGRWTFAAHQAGPVYISGWVYDLYKAAAEACEMWAAKVKFDYDMSDENQSLKRSQKHEHLQAQADRFRKMSRREQAGSVDIQVRA